MSDDDLKLFAFECFGKSFKLSIPHGNAQGLESLPSTCCYNLDEYIIICHHHCLLLAAIMTNLYAIQWILWNVTFDQI